MHTTIATQFLSLPKFPTPWLLCIHCWPSQLRSLPSLPRQQQWLRKHLELVWMPSWAEKAFNSPGRQLNGCLDHHKPYSIPSGGMPGHWEWLALQERFCSPYDNCDRIWEKGPLGAEHQFLVSHNALKYSSWASYCTLFRVCSCFHCWDTHIWSLRFYTCTCINYTHKWFFHVHVHWLINSKCLRVLIRDTTLHTFIQILKRRSMRFPWP